MIIIFRIFVPIKPYRITVKRTLFMNKIHIIGNIGNDISNFRKEVKELEKDWEISYNFQYMCLNNDRVQLTITSKNSYEFKAYLLNDADTISDYLEQKTKFDTENIQIS